MSYILEALRKSERERREIEAEPLVRLAAAPAVPRQSPWRAVIVGVSVIANVAALAYFFGPMTLARRHEPERNASAAAILPKSMQTDRSAELSQSAESPQAVRSEPAAQVLDTPKKGASQGPSKDKVQPSSLAARSMSGKPVSSAVTPNRRPREAAKPREAIPAMTQAPRTPTTPGDIFSQPVQKKAGTWNTPEPDFPRLTETRGAPRDGLPNPKINVYAYSPKSGDDRFVVIRNRKYREGDRTEDGSVVRRIEEEGMTLEFEGETYKVPRP